MSKLRWTGVAAFMVAIAWFAARENPEDSYARTTPEVASETKAKDFTRHEMFRFQKSGKVSFDFSPEVVEQKIVGNLFLDWTSEQVATLSLTANGDYPAVFVKAHFGANFELRCIESFANPTGKESDYTVLLRDLALNYAFKTNRDENGDYVATLSSSQTRVTKVKTRYLDPKKSNLRVEKSFHEFELAGTLMKARGEEEFRLKGGDQAAWAKTTYELVAVQENTQRPTIDLTRPLGRCLQNFQTEAQTSQVMTPEEFKSSLSGLSNEVRGVRLQHTRKVVKALRSNATLLSEFVDWAHSMPNDRERAATVTGVLGSLGTREAQRELVKLFEAADSETKFIQHQVLNAFTLTKAPLTSESRTFLKARVKEEDALAEGAAYALGSSIQNSPEDPESRRDLNFLVNELNSAEDSKSKMVYLDALRNSGSLDVAPVFQKYSLSEDDEVKEKARESLEALRELDQEKL